MLGDNQILNQAIYNIAHAYIVGGYYNFNANPLSSYLGNKNIDEALPLLLELAKKVTTPLSAEALGTVTEIMFNNAKDWTANQALVLKLTDVTGNNGWISRMIGALDAVYTSEMTEDDIERYADAVGVVFDMAFDFLGSCSETTDVLTFYTDEIFDVIFPDGTAADLSALVGFAAFNMGYDEAMTVALFDAGFTGKFTPNRDELFYGPTSHTEEGFSDLAAQYMAAVAPQQGAQGDEAHDIALGKVFGAYALVLEVESFVDNAARIVYSSSPYSSDPDTAIKDALELFLTKARLVLSTVEGDNTAAGFGTFYASVLLNMLNDVMTYMEHAFGYSFESSEYYTNYSIIGDLKGIIAQYTNDYHFLYNSSEVSEVLAEAYAEWIVSFLNNDAYDKIYSKNEKAVSNALDKLISNAGTNDELAEAYSALMSDYFDTFNDCLVDNGVEFAAKNCDVLAYDDTLGFAANFFSYNPDIHKIPVEA